MFAALRFMIGLGVSGFNTSTVIFEFIRNKLAVLGGCYTNLFCHYWSDGVILLEGIRLEICLCDSIR